MRLRRTDNAALRTSFKWFGDPDHPWIFEATGNAWIWALCLIPFSITTLWNLAPRPLIAAAVPGFPGYFLTGVIATITGTVIGILATRFIGRHVTPTEPLAHHLVTFIAELNAPRDPGRTTIATAVPQDLWLEQKHRVTHQFIIPTTTTGDTP